MKLALTFLLAFMAVSCSQRLPKKQPWSLLSLTMPYYSPRALYHLQNPYFLDTVDSIHNPLESTEPEDDTVLDDDVNKNWQSDFVQSQSRHGNRYRPSSLQAQQRFFFGAFNPFLNTNGYTPFWRTGSVVTVTVSSTLTTAIINNCVPSSQLAAGAATITCARKRRSVIENHFDDIEVSPTLVQNVEPTEIPRGRRQLDYQQEILSSKDEEPASGNYGGISRQNRFLWSSSSISGLTSTSISYIFSSTIIKKTLNIAASAGLSCLPSGYVVC